MNKLLLFLLFFVLTNNLNSQNFGEFPKFEKEKLQRDLDLLHQGLDKFHSGMYWYTPKGSVDLAFNIAKNKINIELNVLEFHKIIAPLVALSKEDHTDVFLPKDIKEEIFINEDIRYLPLMVRFLDTKLYCIRNGSDNPEKIETFEIEEINGETPIEIASKIGSLFASDGYIKTLKYDDFSGFGFSRYYYYYYGILENYKVKFKGIAAPMNFKSLPISQININLKKSANIVKEKVEKEPLQFEIIDSKTALITINTFHNPEIKKKSKYKTLKKFLAFSFYEIREKKIENLIIDIAENGGGTEGNEGLTIFLFWRQLSKI